MRARIAFLRSSALRTSSLVGSLAVAGALGASCTDAGPAAEPAAQATTGHIDAAAIAGSDLVQLFGNTPRAANPANSRGPLADDYVIEGMQLVLKRTPEQDAALEAAIDALHDPASPTYHQWMTPEVFADYGVSREDFATVVRWLRSYGFSIESEPASRMFISFTGTVAQIRAAFHTEMHSLVVNGHPHISNMSDPRIPAALSKTVYGVHALHDFMPRPLNHSHGTVKRNKATGTWTSVRGSKPSNPKAQDTFAYTSQGTACTAANAATTCQATLSGAAAACNPSSKLCVECNSDADCFGPSTCDTASKLCQETLYAVAPADFATIYNLNPLFNSGITGAGQTIAVIEDTTVKNVSDVATFRSSFGLSSYTGTFSQSAPTSTSGPKCKAAGVNDAEGEALLDAEWAGATAPDATILLSACKDTGTTFGGLIALENLILGATPPQVVSISYGECESANGNAANQSYVTAYQEAAAAGISVIVAAGDDGATICDGDLPSQTGQTAAEGGITVSGFASTPYNVAVGGTDFRDYYNSAHGGPAQTQYWSASNTGSAFSSALSYIPEMPWNDSCASLPVFTMSPITKGNFTQGYGASGFCNSTIGANFQDNTAGSGGPSAFSKQPTWQTGVFGLPTKSGGARYLPDVSLFAANGVFGHVILECNSDTNEGGGPCVFSNSDDAIAQAGGGTSYAAPSFAGIVALINQKTNATKGIGNPNYTLYKLAGAEFGPNGSTRCNGSGGSATNPTLPDAECIFNDVTFGDIAVNCADGSPNCYGATATAQGVLSTSTTELSTAYPATVGWDFATGLGTVNATNLVNGWSQ